ncbi:MAG TPA: hypothetical protein VEW65_06310, partial [Chryseolinea sp.]|nr:hypothetical protein [Chryseolinea sp.]
FPADWSSDSDVFGISFTDEISIGFVTRSDGAYSYLQKDEFYEMNIAPHELLDTAIKHLETELEDCDIKEYKIPGGSLVYWSSENDNFTAVRILSGKYLSILAGIFGDDFNFSIPDRDSISCWKTNNEDENNKFVIEAMEDYNDSDYRLSDKRYSHSTIKVRK